MDEYVPVNIGDCRCEGTPHEEGDVVYLRPRLDLRRGVTVQRLVAEAHNADTPLDSASLTGVLAEAYLLNGVVSWTMPEPVNEGTIRAHLLSDFSRGAAVADVADDLYLGPVVLPLAKKAAASLPDTQTNGSTSPSPDTGGKRRKRSKPSSTSTTQTGVTAQTSA